MRVKRNVEFEFFVVSWCKITKLFVKCKRKTEKFVILPRKKQENAPERRLLALLVHEKCRPRQPEWSSAAELKQKNDKPIYA